MPVPLPEKVQTAVVTGGARGFGKDVCRSLHRAGFRVIITDVNPERRPPHWPLSWISPGKPL